MSPKKCKHDTYFDELGEKCRRCDKRWGPEERMTKRRKKLRKIAKTRPLTEHEGQLLLIAEDRLRP